MSADDVTNDIFSLVKVWIEADNEIREAQKSLLEKRRKQAGMTNQLALFMKTKGVDVFNISDGHISYTKTKKTAPLNRKHLEKALAEFFKNDETALEASQYILNTREVKEVEKIKRKINGAK